MDRLEIAIERLRHPRPGGRIEAARDYGVDLSLLIANLRLTPAERVSRMHAACIGAEQIEAVQVLTDAGVEFAIIGGWSAIMHGSAHLTSDINFCYSRVSANLQRLAGALAPYHPRPAGFPPELPFV